MSHAATSSPPAIPDYELVRPIGRGSYGDVWLARGVTGIWRAIKIVWRARFADADPFEREFRGLKEFAEISLGESIQLALLHVGRNDAAGFFYYVMELADDANGSRPIDPASYVPLTFAEIHTRRGRLPASECVRFGVDLARSLASLHARGLVHRDVKPSNVILVGGVPKLADIGLVTSSTGARTFVGTEGFVPPEGPGSPAADVFALGKVLYELATGLDRQVFPKLPEGMNRLPDRRALLELNEVILRACEPIPEKRYRDGAALLADLETLRTGRPVRRFAAWQVLTLAAAVAIAGTLTWKAWWPRKPELATSTPPVEAIAPQSVAVLPFANVNGDKEQDYFSDGFSEEVLNALARERELRVPGRSSSFSFKGKNATATEIGRALNVASVVEGSAQRARNRVLIRVQLTHVRDGTTETLGPFDREVADIFALQDEVARAVVEKITHRATSRPFLAVLTKNPDAYDAYMRGRALQIRSAPGASEALEFYDQAVALDPAFALAWARRAEAIFRPYTAQADRRDELAINARVSIDHALEAQPDLPEALVARASWLRHAKGDLAAARRDLARAESLQPATAHLRALQASLAADAADWPAVFRLTREALLLDPQNGDITNAVAINFYIPRGDFAAADRLLEQAITIQGPAASAVFISRVYLRNAWRGPDAALRLIARAPASLPKQDVLRALMLVSSGRREGARALVDSIYRGSDPRDPAAAGFADYRAYSVLTLLKAVGRDDWAHNLAEQTRTEILKGFALGNRAPHMWRLLVRAEIALDHRASALGLLDEWRAYVQQLPSAHLRILEFNEKAAPLYACLGQVDEAATLMREGMTNGYMGLDFFLRYSLDFAGVADDPRIKSLFKQLHDWAAAQPDPTD